MRACVPPRCLVRICMHQISNDSNLDVPKPHGRQRPGGSVLPLIVNFSDALVPSGWQWENEKSMMFDVCFSIRQDYRSLSCDSPRLALDRREDFNFFSLGTAQAHSISETSWFRCIGCPCSTRTSCVALRCVLSSPGCSWDGMLSCVALRIFRFLTKCWYEAVWI